MADPAHDLFDIHQHVGVIEGISGHGAGAAEADPVRADLDQRLRSMANLGIRQAALMPGHSYPRPNGLADTRKVNDSLAAYRSLSPDRFPAVCGTVEPRYGEAGLEEIDRMGRELKFQGVSWHHRQQGLPIDHPIMHRFMERMASLGLVALVHCYTRADMEAVWRLRRLAAAFPEATFICLDSMTHQETFEEALAAAGELSNIVLETASSILGARAIERVVDTLGAERLLLGTNIYSNRVVTHIPGLQAISEARISQAERSLILGANARRLLRL